MLLMVLFNFYNDNVDIKCIVVYCAESIQTLSGIISISGTVQICVKVIAKPNSILGCHLPADTMEFAHTNQPFSRIAGEVG